MKNKMENWVSFQFSSGGFAGSDYIAFQKNAKIDLKAMAEENGFVLHGFSKGHYEFSAVLKDKETETYIYVSISDVRFFPNKWWYEVLYRTMAHEKDWTGGSNCFCRWSDIGVKARQLVKKTY
jgi:hypothetical protein